MEVWELYLNILCIQQRFSCTLGDGDSGDAIERRIEGAASREDQKRGWDLMEIEDLVRGMLAETQCTL
jgi:hypothetical protein